MTEKLQAIVGAKISEFRKKMAEVKKIARSVPNKIVVNVEVRVKKFQQDINRVANNIQALGTVMTNALGGTALMISPALVPLIATVVGGLGAVVSGFGFAALAAIAFTAVAIPGIMKLFDETTKLNGAQKKAKGEFDKFTKTFQRIAKELEKPVLQAFSTSMQIAHDILHMAEPLFKSSATAVNNLLNSLKQSLGTPPVKEFFDYMNKNAGPMLETLGKSVGNFIQGFMSMMVAFGPLAEDMANGLLNMSTRFAEWAANLQNNQSFQNFLNYVRENAPKVMTLIGNLTTFLVNLGIGLAPLGTKILDIVNSFLSWSNSMMQTHPWIAQVVGVLIMLTGAFIALTPMIIAAKVLFSGFGTTIMGMVGKVLPLINLLKMNLVIGVRMMMQSLGFLVVKSQATAVSLVSSFGKMIASAGKAAGKFIVHIAKMGARYAWLGVQALIHAARIAASWFIALGPVGWVIATVIALVILIIANWETVKKWTIKIWTAVSEWVVKTAKNIAKAVKEKFTEIVNSVREKMNNVKTKIQDGWNQVMSFLRGINLAEIGRNIIQGLINGIGSMAGALVDKAKGVVNGAIEGAKSLLGIHSPSRVFMEIGKFTGEGMAIGMNKMAGMVSKASVNMARAAMIEPQRTQFAFDAGLSTSDFGRIRHDIGAEVSNFEMDPTINVINTWDGEKVVSYVERGSAKRLRITDGFGGK